MFYNAINVDHDNKIKEIDGYIKSKDYDTLYYLKDNSDTENSISTSILKIQAINQVFKDMLEKYR